MQFKMSFISVMQSWIFCSHYSSLHDLMLSHDPSEIILICWLAAQETFLIIIYSQVHKYWDIDTILTFLALYTTTMDFKWNEQDVL